MNDLSLSLTLNRDDDIAAPKNIVHDLAISGGLGVNFLNLFLYMQQDSSLSCKGQL